MKWKQAPDPKEGDTHTYSKFAWFPTLLCTNNEWYKVWLETYRITEAYQRTYVFTGGYSRYELRWTILKREPLFGDHE